MTPNNRKTKKLVLRKESVAQLSTSDLARVQGGQFTYRPYGCQYGSQISGETACATDCP